MLTVEELSIFSTSDTVLFGTFFMQQKTKLVAGALYVDIF